MRRGLLVLLFFMAGCGFLRPQKKEYFSLETIEPAAGRAAVQGLPVGIDVLELPPPIDRREITVRQSDGELELRGRELWSAPIEAMAVHTFAFDLAARLPEGMVVLPGQARPTGAMRSVEVIVEEFNAGPEPVLVFDGRWSVRDADGTTRTQRERITVDMTSLDSAQIATAMSRALATLADRIVARL